jgi:hypothetical protein
MLARADGTFVAVSSVIFDLPKFADDACITLFCPTKQTALSQGFSAWPVTH